MKKKILYFLCDCKKCQGVLQLLNISMWNPGQIHLYIKPFFFKSNFVFICADKTFESRSSFAAWGKYDYSHLKKIASRQHQTVI